MAFELQLTDAEEAALRDLAEREGRSLEDIVAVAISCYLAGRRGRIQESTSRILSEDSELLQRLASERSDDVSESKHH